MLNVHPPTDEEPPLSEAMRQVLEALIEGVSPPPEAQAALTDAEREEIAALARVARLTGLTLARPEPSEEAARQALSRAQDALAGEYRTGTPGSADTPRSWWKEWLDRLRRRQSDQDNGG